MLASIGSARYVSSSEEGSGMVKEVEDDACWVNMVSNTFVILVYSCQMYKQVG